MCPPNGVHVIQVESAQDMFDAVKANLDVSCAIFAAAVADWRVENASGSKIKKQNGACRNCRCLKIQTSLRMLHNLEQTRVHPL